LANPTRLAILELLRDGPRNVTEISEALNQEQSMISHNLKPLERCRFVFSERRKKEHFYSLNKETMERLFKIFSYHAEKYCPTGGKCLTDKGLQEQKKEEEKRFEFTVLDSSLKESEERMVQRSIVRIDEEKCTGCGLCIPACAEGALKIVDGKAKLVSDKYCDGLGACLGECPQGAITIEKREAEEFDEEATEEHLKRKPSVPTVHHAHPTHQPCPSAQVTHFERNLTEKETVKTPEEMESMLTQWPVQLTLLPTNAPFLENADLLIAADCVPFAYANFHNDFP
jgi:ferredoxin/DNA-binding transcriptional ArsR family regulator